MGLLLLIFLNHLLKLKDTAQFTISGWSLSDCLNDRLKVTFDDQEVTEMRK